MARQSIKSETTKPRAGVKRQAKPRTKASLTCEVVLDFARDTPNTFRYEAVDDTAPIRVLYIQKAGRKTAPKRITVTVA